MDLSIREQEIIKYLLVEEKTTVTQIARYMGLSNKTITQSLNNIESLFKGSDVELIRKANVGVFLRGDREKIYSMINQKANVNRLQTREERIQFLCFNILQKTDYFTLQDLMDITFVSKSTMEKDLQEVTNVFQLFNVTIDRIPGRGSFLNLMEQERRKLALDLILYFWGQNWHIVKREEYLIHLLESIPDFVSDFFNKDSLIQLNKVLQEFVESTNFVFSDFGYQSLLLHLLIAIERIKEGKNLKEPVQEELSEEFQEEARLLIQLIEASFQVTLSQNELYYIRMHLESNNNRLKKKDAVFYQPETRIEDTVLTVIRDFLPSYDQKLLDGIVSHLKMAVNRLLFHLPIKHPFLDDVKKHFPISFEEAIYIKDRLEKAFQISVPDDEVAFLAVHIQAYKERIEELSEDKLKVLIVCNSGKGTSQLLAARMRKNFSQLEVFRILSVQQLFHTEVIEDLILSTVNLEIENRKVLVISPLLDIHDQARIQEEIHEKQKSNDKQEEAFAKLISSNTLFLDKDLSSVDDVLTYLVDELAQRDIVQPEIIESVKNRENLSFTSFGRFATPHGDPKYVNQSKIAFLRLANPINWGTTQVKFVFFICIKDESPQQLEQIYDALLEIIDHPVQQKLTKGDYQQVWTYLKGRK